jgi:hypothetical protein
VISSLGGDGASKGPEFVSLNRFREEFSQTSQGQLNISIRVRVDKDVLVEVKSTDIPEGLKAIAKRFYDVDSQEPFLSYALM